jgi:hypothetical protein
MDRGRAEGGLALLARHRLGCAGLPQPELSREGWYWSATLRDRGCWTPYKLGQGAETIKALIESELEIV